MFGEKVMMKKMLMMTAVAAMAFGAQADLVDYKYDLTLQSIPTTLFTEGKLQGIKCYLVDSSVTGSDYKYGSKGAIMAELTYSGYSYSSENKMELKYTVSGFQPNGDMTKSSQPAAVMVAADNKPKEGYVGLVTFQVAQGVIQWKDMGNDLTELNTYADKNLKAYLIATVDNGAGGTVEKEFTLAVTGNGSIIALGSSATYQQVIPEPTSGMLVFLGLAGLMLKRKRAA